MPAGEFKLNGPKGLILTGSDGSDNLKGRAGGDVISAGDGIDWLYGAGGSDTLDGGDGSDFLYGGAGADQLTGGLGRDTFLLSGRVGATFAELDRITDFTSGEDRLGFSDRFSLAGSEIWTGAEETYADALALATQMIDSDAADVVAIQVGSDVIVFADADFRDQVGGAVVLADRTAADIGAWDVF